MADALLAIGGSSQTLAILPTLGFKPYGDATRYARCLRPLRRSDAGADGGWRGALKLVRRVVWTLSANSRHDGDWKVGRVTADELKARTWRCPFLHAAPPSSSDR